jgi:hypothetical protein
MAATKVVKMVTDKLEQLAAQGRLAEWGYTPLEVIVRDNTGVLHLHPFPRATLEDVVDYLKFFLPEKRTNMGEIFLVTDCYTDSTLGTTLADAIVIIHCQTNQRFSVGLIEYDPGSNPFIHKEVNWNNPFWIEQMSAVGQTLCSYLGEQIPVVVHCSLMKFDNQIR